MSSSHAEERHRQALAKAVDEARARAEVLTKAAGRSLGSITKLVEVTGGSVVPYAAERASLDAATSIVPGTRTRRPRSASPSSSADSLHDEDLGQRGNPPQEVPPLGVGS